MNLFHKLMDVHLKNKYIDSKGPALGTPTMALFSMYSKYLFGYII